MTFTNRVFSITNSQTALKFAWEFCPVATHFKTNFPFTKICCEGCFPFKVKQKRSEGCVPWRKVTSLWSGGYKGRAPSWNLVGLAEFNCFNQIMRRQQPTQMAGLQLAAVSSRRQQLAQQTTLIEKAIWVHKRDWETLEPGWIQWKEAADNENEAAQLQGHPEDATVVCQSNCV